MKNWDLRTADATPSHPRILSSSGDARVVVVDLPAGERLAEHEVHERAFVLIVDGEVEMLPESGERVAGYRGICSSSSSRSATRSRRSPTRAC